MEKSYHRPKEINTKEFQGKEVNLFVYGTLMKKNRKGQAHLDDAKYLGECTLKGYALYDLGYHPGIVEDDDETVKGEAGLKPSSTAYMS